MYENLSPKSRIHNAYRDLSNHHQAKCTPASASLPVRRIQLQLHLGSINLQCLPPKSEYLLDFRRSVASLPLFSCAFSGRRESNLKTAHNLGRYNVTAFTLEFFYRHPCRDMVDLVPVGASKRCSRRVHCLVNKCWRMSCCRGEHRFTRFAYRGRSDHIARDGNFDIWLEKTDTSKRSRSLHTNIV